MQAFKILTAGDSALTLEFGKSIDPATSAAIRAALLAVKEAKISGITELVQTYCTLMIHYDPLTVDYTTLCAKLKEVLSQAGAEGGSAVRRIVEIPVCYGGQYGPDMENVCKHTGYSEAEMVERHANKPYQIYMLGFLPGFAYLGGMDETLATPRLASPRAAIDPGAVGIAGSQTGIYPLASPGGWQLIGRTPVRVYDPARAKPILYEAGEYICFKPVDETEYKRIEAAVQADTYECVIREEAAE